MIKDYESKNIFNADETALFYKAMPNKTMFYKNLPANHVKVDKERLSVLFCANMSGTEKLKPIVIGKSENPRCLKDINKANLPVEYRHNTRAWMTDCIFREWLLKIDKYFKSLDRNVLLFLDNFSGHCNDDKITKKKQTKEPLKLTNIKLHFFPANCTSVLQPMDQGIIQSFKMKYRRSIVEDKLEALNTDSTMPELNVLFAINKIHKCWKEITVSTIKHCFHKGGFKHLSLNVNDVIVDVDMNNEKEVFKAKWALLNNKQGTFDFNQFQYVSIDDNLECHGELTDEQIVEAVQASAQSHFINDKAIDDEDSNDQFTPVISTATAMTYLNSIRLYFLQSKDDTSEFLLSLEKMETFLDSKRVFCQKSIIDYIV